MGKRNRRGKDKMAKHRQNPPWKDIVKENEKFEKYYKVIIYLKYDSFLGCCDRLVFNIYSWSRRNNSKIG